MKSVINSYRLQPGPVQSPPTIAGRIVPVAAPTSYRRAVVILAALLLPLLAIGVVVYAARTVQPREVQAPAASAPVVAEPSPVVVERVVEVTAPPVIVVVTATPANSGQGAVVGGQPQPQAAPVQVAPVAPRQAAPQALPQAVPQAQPTPRPRIQPTAPPPVTGGPVRAAGVQAQPTAASGPQERLLSRDCVHPSAPQGTVIRGYYTDKAGVQRDAICRADGWKAVD